MNKALFYGCCLATLCLAVSATSEKQIKLEDIEKDTLKAAQQAKYEKQIQQQQQQQYQQQHQQYHQQQQTHPQQIQQQPQYQQTAYQYDPQVYAQQSITYQTPTYSQYFVPQQYIPQSVVSGYTPLTSNSLSAGISTPSAFQTYLTPQLTTIPSVTSFHTAQPLAVATQTQPIYTTFTSPSLTTFHQQPFYQSALQYYPTQGQATQFYFAPQATEQTSGQQLSSNLVYQSSNQQYVGPYQQAAPAKTAAPAATSYNQQYVSTAPQTFPAQSVPAQQEYTSIYSQPSYSSNSGYTNTETPTFVTVKAPQHLVASQNQQQQYIQSQPSTISPLQTKYLNSPQYLAANYNTIQSSHLYPKGPLSSGVKSTVSPPLKGPIGGGSNGYVPNSYVSQSSSVSSYQPFRSLPGKNY